MFELLKDIIDFLAVKRKERKMGNSNTQKKHSYVNYVYGQIFAAWYANGKQQYTLVKNKDAQCWKRILNWLKKEEYIEGFELGDTVETAGQVLIEGFNEEKKMYERYIEAIAKRIDAEKEELKAA